jgi:multicomponent Na+:H+ antiporter subunit D
MLTGGLGALAQTDSRRLLGYLVISGIGSMLAGIAIGGPDAVAGTLFYALHSMLVMTALYLAIGLAARLGAGFSLAVPSGLYRDHAALAFLTLALFFSVSGLPPFSGFWPKVMLVKAALDAGAVWLAGALLLTGFLTMIATGRLFLLSYWRTKDERTAGAGQAGLPVFSLPVKRLPVTIVAPLVVLTALSLLIGLFPETLLALARQAALTLTTPTAYLDSVFAPGSLQ